MRIALYQFAPVLGDKSANFAKVARALSGVAADLVVLPELFNTGYSFQSRVNVAHAAEDLRDGPTAVFLGKLARETGAVIVGGAAELNGSLLHNSCLSVMPDGKFRIYRKIHLFNKEKMLFDAGTDVPQTWQAGGVTLGVQVCFDYFFPELTRTLALAGVQVMCHPANLVLQYAQQITVARAMENRIFWILCNRVGAEDFGESRLSFTGQSQIVSPDGEILFRAGASEEVLKVIEIDPAQATSKMVGGNDLFRDRRPDVYRL